jgi:PEP-CTERM motif
MISKVFSLAVLAAGLAAVPAMAGFVVTTGTDIVNSSSPPPAVGESFSVSDGTFALYAPGSPSDPQVLGDLSSYNYTLDGTIQSISGETITYTGTYEITYTFNPGSGTVVVPVSSGVSAFSATFAPGTNDAAVTGTLTQTTGPQGPFASSFTNLGAEYGGNPVDIAATYIGGIADPTVGTIQGTLTQTAAPVPEPATLSLALIGGAGLLVGRNRRQRNA